MNKQAIRGVLSLVFGAVALVAAVGFINQVPETHAVEYPETASSERTTVTPDVEPVEATVEIGEVTVKSPTPAPKKVHQQHCYERVLEQQGRPGAQTVIYCD